MATRHALLLAVCCMAALWSAGCHLETDPYDPPQFPSRAGSVVINEVFTLPLTDQNFHSWIELYNPTGAEVDLTGWTLEFTTARVPSASLLFKGLDIDTSFTPPETSVVYIGRDSLASGTLVVGRFPVAFAGQGTSSDLSPESFLVLVTNKERMLTFTAEGPGQGPETVSTPLFITNPETTKVAVLPDYSNIGIPDTVRFLIYPFFLLTTEEIVLRDPGGIVRDVVRYGNYVAPSPDPYPGNRSFGAISAFQAIARYAGGYKTGSTADDFYMTEGRQLPPLPKYYSQRSK